jgi:ribonucleoside-diphosphate reductase alpha chain
MRAEDTVETMTEKVRIATWIGAFQASFTHFPYLRPAWSELCEEDRLLGVDITGQCDNPTLSQDPEVMLRLNQVARETAAEATAWLGINYPAAITCGKPSGNSSQLVDCASGFHPRYAPYYIRRVRTDAKDPLTQLLRDSGVPMHKENGMEHLSDAECSVWVVEFPVAAPQSAMLRESETAIETLQRYLHIMRTWCGERGHNQSITVYVRDHEWDAVGDFVFEHFDEITGVSFLPYSGGKYNLAPYEEIDEATYRKLISEFPVIAYDALPLYEKDDMGQGAQELACMGGSCEV